MPSTARSLSLLGLTLPKISGKSQADVDAKLAEWKRTTLKKAWRSVAKRLHPDKGSGDGIAFAEAKAAYEHLRGLKANLRPPLTPEGRVVESLRKHGVIDGMIEHLRGTGELATLSEMSLTSGDFLERVRVLQQRQRLGLFGPYSTWE